MWVKDISPDIIIKMGINASGVIRGRGKRQDGRFSYKFIVLDFMKIAHK